VHARLQGPRPVVQELGPLRKRADDDAAGDRRFLRHVLLQPRLRVLCVAAGPRAPAAGLGEPLRVRAADRDRHRPGAGRPAPDARVARLDVHEEDRPVLLGDRPALEAG
jgi:hypothetical protein